MNEQHTWEWRAGYDYATEKYKAEIDRLCAENARLRQVHSEMLTFMKEVQQALPSIFTDKARSILSRTTAAPPAADQEQQTPG